ncbi:MAG: cyclic nucleotide-binding domain-containing protein [Acidobacteriota bacterium]
MDRERHDLVVVGAGPAGLSAAGHAREEGLSCVLLERTEHLADTVFRYQKRKHVMAEPGLIPLRSPLGFEAGSREAVLAAWERFAAERDLDVRFRHEVTAVEKEAPDGGFLVRTAAGAAFAAPHVVLALGTQGNPRKLGVPGEDLPHVTDRLVDPAEHRDRDVVVVGAGDSALEVALALCEANRVSLVVRKPEIVRAKEALEREALQRQAAGELTIHFSTTVERVEEGAIVLASPDGVLEQPADLVIAKIGTYPPRAFLEGLGIELTGPGREAPPKLGRGYESSVPGLHLIGAVSGRDLIKLGINQGYEVVEHILGRDVEPADEEVLRERLPWWGGRVRDRIAEVADEIPLFQGASQDQLREMFLSVRPLEVPPGETVIRQNDYTDSVFLIREGEVDVSAVPEGSEEERHLATLRPGNFFGEMSLISGRRRNATATARTPARLLEVPRKAMLKLLTTAPEVKESVDRIFMIRAFQGYLFPGVPEHLLWEVVGKAEQVRLERDRVIFEEGDEGDAFYLIRSGQVKISKRSAEAGGREIVLSYLVAGNFFGETALLSGDRRTATVTTIFPTELIRLARADFEHFLERHPELRAQVETKLEERRVASLIAEATPGAGNVLSELIREEVVMGTDALIIDNHKCIRCGNCIAACEGVHDDGQARLSLTGISFYNLLAPNSCWQCEDPLCMLDCPPDAIVRDPSGEVYIKSNCIGCGNCEANCPYGNIFMVHPRPEPSLWEWVGSIFGFGGDGSGEGRADEPADGGSDQALAVKCDLCRDLGNDPACVRSCPTAAAIRLGPEEYRQTLEELVVRRGEV